MKSPRYFIHCNTTGVSSNALFQSREVAWRVYGENAEGEGGDWGALEAAIPATATDLFVVKVYLPYSDEPSFFLASSDRLFARSSTLGGDGALDFGLLEVSGVMHVSTEHETGGYGSPEVVFDSPICQDAKQPVDAHYVSLEDVFDRPLNELVCPDCLKLMVGDGFVVTPKC
ncbi:hypothetical protein A9762_12355 [Pandoraea sp. ISTKB]|nr:hypothetical protein A9762_12355 [Pandoraea sp. ISTKB]